MKLKLAAAAGIVALVALTLSIVTAASATPRSHRHRHHEVRLHLFQPANSDQLTQVDANDNNKFDTGDYVIDTGPLYNAAGTTREGSFKSIFDVVDKNHFAVRTIFLLHKGQITTDGVIDASATRVRIAITGGTQAYEAASGEVKVLIGNNGQTNFNFELILLERH